MHFLFQESPSPGSRKENDCGSRRAWEGPAGQAASQGAWPELPELPQGFLTLPLLSTSLAPGSCNCQHFSRQNRDGYFAAFPQDHLFFVPPRMGRTDTMTLKMSKRKNERKTLTVQRPEKRLKGNLVLPPGLLSVLFLFWIFKTRFSV